MAGRPTKFTKETQKKLIDAIMAGSVYELACLYAGISYASFRGWMVKGEKAKTGEFFKFFNAIKEAEGAGALEALLLIRKAASLGDWRAAGFLVERRYPQHYGRTRVEHTGVGGLPMQAEISPGRGLDYSKLSDEELAALEALTLKATRAVESAPAVQSLPSTQAVDGGVDDDGDSDA